MHDEIDLALAALADRRLLRAERDADVLALRFDPPHDGDPGAATNGDGVSRESLLRVACPWRLTDGERVLVGSGDLFTPADPDEEPETFDWEPLGASWLDVRLAELGEKWSAAPPVVERVAADRFGGVRLELVGGLLLELFPNSTPTGHVSTEFWRLERAGAADALVVGTFGVEREPGA